jgi:hypothetical protein
VPPARTASSKQAFDEVAVQGEGPPKDASVAGKPSFGYVDEYVTAEVLIVRIEPTADASLAAMRDRRRLGIAIAAMIRMIATTISNSISEKPFCFFISTISLRV